MSFNEDKIVKDLRNPATRRQAFDAVVRQYTPSVYNNIRRMVLYHDDADDVMQNTFIKAWTSLDKFRGDSKISTWLYRIAYNECLTFLEKNSRTISMDDEGASVSETLMADEYFDGDEMQARFIEAVESLPDKQKQTFNMKYFQEMKYEDIAEITGTSIGALKASYHFAVKKIEEFFNRID